MVAKKTVCPVLAANTAIIDLKTLASRARTPQTNEAPLWSSVSDDMMKMIVSLYPNKIKNEEEVIRSVLTHKA